MLGLTSDAPPGVCSRCATELPPQALACPRCSALVHRARLTELADLAAAAADAGDAAAARAPWQEARDLVPARSQQHEHIQARLMALAGAVNVEGQPRRPASASGWIPRVLGGVLAVGLLLAGKLKFLLLGLSKLSTAGSMFGFIAVYWGIYGWPLAVGLAGSIYIHEMGHVAMLRRLGIKAGAPLFIPGFGALVMLRERITDPVTDARIGLAGPVWGLSAAVGAWVVYLATGAPIWLAIAELTGFLNLFNLVPVWQLDGARGFHALSTQERWVAVGAVAIALWATGLGLLWIVGGVAAYRAVRDTGGPGHTPTLVTFCSLVFALAWFASDVS